MTPARTAKIIIILCILSLFVGMFCIDSNSSYNNSKKYNKSSKIVSNVNKIAVMELEGTIASSYESALFSGETTSANLLKSLKMADDDNSVKGVIIKINSPGGTVAMSQNIYNQIIKLRKKKPVIAVFDDVAASGGYYIASACDRIVAQSGSLTGSIGVIFSFMDYHNLLSEKLNINPVVIKSGRYKDIGSGTRAMTEDEKKLMQNIVDDSYSQFIEAITNGRVNRKDSYTAQKRDLELNVLKENADGRIFTGRQAFELGFADALGGMDIAQTMIEKMAQEKFSNLLSAKLVNYNKKSTLSEYLYSISEYNSKTNFQLFSFIPKSFILNRRPLYLWE